MTEAYDQGILNAQHNTEIIRQETEQIRRSPSVLYRPRLFLDGDQYCALYGDNIQEGCAGFGYTASDAMADFDRNWGFSFAPTNKGRSDSDG